MILVLALMATATETSKTIQGIIKAKRAKFPESPLNATQQVLASIPKAQDGAKRILIVGDSWGTVVSGGSALGISFFDQTLKEHDCNFHATSIAIPGTMATDWDSGQMREALMLAATLHDVVWIILMGNDALDQMPDCADTGKSASACGEKLYKQMLVHMGSIVDSVHAANPTARVVGFGYDTMFGGLGCSLITHELFPQCWKLFHSEADGNRCFNEQFLRIQNVWETVAANRSWVDATSILGATQVAAGDSKASTGADRHIDMEKMGPGKYWPDYEGCFHPGVFGGNQSGASIVMEEFYRVYWSGVLGC